jgi:hypothetical protein
LLEEQRGLGEFGGKVASNFYHRGLGKDQSQETKFAEDEDRVAGASAGEQTGDQDISIDADSSRLSLLWPGHLDPSRQLSRSTQSLHLGHEPRHNQHSRTEEAGPIEVDDRQRISLAEPIFLAQRCGQS